MAKSKVLHRFPYSENGYTVKNMKVGDEIDFGAATQSLIDRGVIESATKDTDTVDTKTVDTKPKKKK